ncbi:MAG: hypothetical protein ABW163_09500, partial [Luteimonas sp.]
MAISLHLAGLLLLLQVPDGPRLLAPRVEPDPTALRIRFIRPSATSSPSPPPTAPSSSTVAIPTPTAPSLARVGPARIRTPKLTTTPPTQPAANIESPPAPFPAVAPTIAIISSPSAPGDGGFQQRLRDAQHKAGVRALPGSDVHRAPGIQLIDPMKQGIGAIMRDTQRLFGVTNPHCIDVDVWAHISPEQRIERHVSLADIRRL